MGKGTEEAGFSPVWKDVHDRDGVGREHCPGTSLPWAKVLALDQNVDTDQKAKNTTEGQENVSEPQ